MKEFAGKTAVITGGASGIGLALAKALGRKQMRVVIADIEDNALHSAKDELDAIGADVLAAKTDVSSAEDVARLASDVVSHFGTVHLLVNNAGVAGAASTWKSTKEDWEWVLGVNLLGVAHCLREFVPHMIANKQECHIVNTSSLAGLLPFHPDATYHATKHAVVAMSEHLYYDMQEHGGRIGVSVLCPGWVSTRIVDAARNRPKRLRVIRNEAESSELRKKKEQRFREYVKHGMLPDELAAITIAAIRDRRFYVLSTREQIGLVMRRAQAIVSGHNPPARTA